MHTYFLQRTVCTLMSRVEGEAEKGELLWSFPRASSGLLVYLVNVISVVSL